MNRMVKVNPVHWVKKRNISGHRAFKNAVFSGLGAFQISKAKLAMFMIPTSSQYNRQVLVALKLRKSGGGAPTATLSQVAQVTDFLKRVIDRCEIAQNQGYFYTLFPNF